MVVLLPESAYQELASDGNAMMHHQRIQFVISDDLFNQHFDLVKDLFVREQLVAWDTVHEMYPRQIWYTMVAPLMPQTNQYQEPLAMDLVADYDTGTGNMIRLKLIPKQ